jgi:hypothetical protein
MRAWWLSALLAGGAADAQIFPLEPNQDLIGLPQQAEAEQKDTLPDIARRNLPDGRLYYFRTDPSGRSVIETHPISVGQMDWKTPIGVTKIVQKEKNPTWYPPKSVRDKHLQGHCVSVRRSGRWDGRSHRQSTHQDRLGGRGFVS